MNNEGPNEMNDTSNSSRICNRHKARLLKNLEDAGCPVVFRDAVTTGLNWLRSDLNENERNEATNGIEENTASGNR